jgi:hypothetical protein
LSELAAMLAAARRALVNEDAEQVIERFGDLDRLVSVRVSLVEHAAFDEGALSSAISRAISRSGSEVQIGRPLPSSGIRSSASRPPAHAISKRSRGP